MSHRLVLPLDDDDYHAFNTATKPRRGFITGGTRTGFKAHAWVRNRRFAIGTYQTEYEARVAIHKITTSDDPEALLKTRYPMPRVIRPRTSTPEERNAITRATLIRRLNIAASKEPLTSLSALVNWLEQPHDQRPLAVPAHDEPGTNPAPC